MSSTANRVIKNTGFLYAKMGITMFISLYTTRLILNSLGASDFGIFNIVGGAIAMLGFLNAAMASATQRFMSYSEGEGDKEKQKSIFNISFVLHFFIALVVGLALVVAGWFFFNGILNIPPSRVFAAKVVYGSLIVSTMFTVMTVPYDAVMNAHENMKYYAIVGVFESLLKLAVAFITVYTLCDKLIVYGILMACIPLIVLTIMRVYCHKHYEECLIAPRKYWNASLMKEIASFAGWNFIGSMGSFICNYGNGVVVNHFFGTIVNAALGIVNQINGQMLAFSNNMMKALNPVIVKSEGAHDRQKMLNFSLMGCRISFFLFSWIAIPVIVEADFILKLWLKNVPEWTVLFMRFQMVRTLLELSILSLNTSLSATGQIKELNILSVVFNLTPLFILCFLFSMGFPPYWLYIVMLTVVVTQNLLKLNLCHKYCSLSYGQYFQTVFFPLLFTALLMLVMGFIVTLLMNETFIRLVLSVVLQWTVLVSVTWFVVLSHDEKTILNNLLNKKRVKKQKI